MKIVKVNEIEIGNDKPFVLIAGLNVLEDEKNNSFCYFTMS